MQETSVRDIKPRGSPRRAVVRIALSGENRNRDNHLYEIGFMFVDHLGTTIEGSLLEDHMDQFRDKLKEGKVYKLESFMIVDPGPVIEQQITAIGSESHKTQR